jgi:hypothetical protein
VLRARLAQESDASVQLALRYALLSLGEPGALPPLPSPCREKPCEEAMLLLRWAPQALKKELDPRALATLMRNQGATAQARGLAAAELSDMGESQTLPDDAVKLLLEQCAEDRGLVAQDACDGVAFLKQLTRERVARLVLEYPGARAALFYRWGDVAEPADLKVFREYYAQANKDPKRKSELVSIARAASQLPGSEAAATLADWYVEATAPTVTAFIAAAWTRRPEATPEQREALLTRVDENKRLLLLVGADDPRAAARAWGEHAHKLDTSAAYLAGELSRLNLEPRLWELTSYHDPNFYPNDIALRRAALGALIRITLRRTPPAAQPAAVAGGAASASP